MIRKDSLVSNEDHTTANHPVVMSYKQQSEIINNGEVQLIADTDETKLKDVSLSNQNIAIVNLSKEAEQPPYKESLANAAKDLYVVNPHLSAKGHMGTHVNSMKGISPKKYPSKTTDNNRDWTLEGTKITDNFFASDGSMPKTMDFGTSPNMKGTTISFKCDTDLNK